MSLSVTDLFCGAGGSSLGAELAGAKLHLGLNHWARAIETHAANFQEADHDCADISALTTSQIRRYPHTDILLASPECTNHSLAKGAQRKKPQAGSLFDDGPAGDEEQDRSRATMWDVVRFAEQKTLAGKPYKAIVVENVPDAFKWGYNDDGGLFEAWRQAMTALGYRHEIVWLNSMFAPPTPQSRDRMYVVFWRKGVRKPNLKIEPPSWCQECRELVPGQQAWKNPGGRVWGKYGQQYLYVCPNCAKPVLPGVFPAASAIDWDIPAPLIGERDKPLAENTIARIRRGLTRLHDQPFAIRLLQSGTARPTTLPFVTLTQRHDLALITPLAGGTFERTPGNRARDADTQPFVTVHGTYAQALVVANRANNVAREAGSEPAFPVLTGGSLAALIPMERNTHAREAGEEPAHALKAGGFHHALVMRNNLTKGDPGMMCTATDDEPFRTLTTACHQSLVIPYNRTGVSREAEYEPASTLSQRDRLALLLPPDTPPPPPPPREWTDADIDACGFRMFEIPELKRTMQMHAHSDGNDYVITGNKREQMAQIGNAVTPPAMTILVERIAEALG